MAQPLPIETLTAKLRREAELKGRVTSTDGLTKPSTPVSDYRKFTEDLFKETTRRFGPSAHDTATETYEEDRFTFVSDAASFPYDMRKPKLKTTTLDGREVPEGMEGMSDEKFDFISKAEGFRENTYDDIKGIKTVGYGTNLEDPAQQSFVKQALGYSDQQLADLKAGKRSLNKKEARAVFELSVNEAEKIVDTKFKGVDLTQHERLALVSLAYNSPSLLGPNLTAHIKSGNKEEAMKEILYRSNREKNKGLAYRRYKEAQMFIGRASSGSLPDISEYIQEYT